MRPAPDLLGGGEYEKGWGCAHVNIQATPTDRQPVLSMECGRVLEGSVSDVCGTHKVRTEAVWREPNAVRTVYTARNYSKREAGEGSFHRKQDHP